MFGEKTSRLAALHFTRNPIPAPVDLNIAPIDTWRRLDTDVMHNVAYSIYHMLQLHAQVYYLAIHGHVPYLFVYPISNKNVYNDYDANVTMQTILDRFSDEFQHFGGFTVFFPPRFTASKPFKRPKLAPKDDQHKARRPLVKSIDPFDQVLVDEYSESTRERAGAYQLQPVKNSRFLIIAESDAPARKMGAARSRRPMLWPDTQGPQARILKEAERTILMAKKFHEVERDWAARAKDGKPVIADLVPYTHDLPGSFNYVDNSDKTADWDETPSWSTRRIADSLKDLGYLAWTQGEGSSYVYQSRTGYSVFGLHNEDVGSASVNVCRGFSMKRGETEDDLVDETGFDENTFRNQPFKAWAFYGKKLIDGVPDKAWSQDQPFSQTCDWLNDEEKKCGQRYRHATIYVLPEQNDPTRFINIQIAGSTTFTLLGALHQGINMGSTTNEAIACAPARFKQMVEPLIHRDGQPAPNLDAPAAQQAARYVDSCSCCCDLKNGIGKAVITGEGEAKQSAKETMADHRIRWQEFVEDRQERAAKRIKVV